jgi:large subunit ribosomal protein L16
MKLNVPQNLKYKKYSKKFSFKKGCELKSSLLFFGSSCGLVAKESGSLTFPQLKTCFSILNKHIKTRRKDRKKLHCSVIIRSPLTEKPLGARMGRGKGSVSKWICFVRKGRMLFQFNNVKRVRFAVLALRKIAYKLPILTRIVLKQPLFYRRYISDK